MSTQIYFYQRLLEAMTEKEERLSQVLQYQKDRFRCESHDYARNMIRQEMRRTRRELKDTRKRKAQMEALMTERLRERNRRYRKLVI